jgi:hypothetical protein
VADLCRCFSLGHDPNHFWVDHSSTGTASSDFVAPAATPTTAISTATHTLHPNERGNDVKGKLYAGELKLA